MSVTVTGVFERSDGTPLAGAVLFRPCICAVVDKPIPVVVTASVVEGILDDLGAFTVDLTASDDPLWRVDAPGMPYEVLVRVEGAKADYHAYINQGTGAINLADVIKLDAAPDIALDPGFVTSAEFEAYKLEAAAANFVAIATTLPLKPGEGQPIPDPQLPADTGPKFEYLDPTAVNAQDTITRWASAMTPGRWMGVIEMAFGPRVKFMEREFLYEPVYLDFQAGQWLAYDPATHKVIVVDGPNGNPVATTPVADSTIEYFDPLSPQAPLKVMLWGKQMGMDWVGTWLPDRIAFTDISGVNKNIEVLYGPGQWLAWDESTHILTAVDKPAG